jgi:hypothetical protein
MAKPWKKIPADLSASTNAVISDAGGTDEDAAWVRANNGKNAKLLVTWIREQRGAEEAALELAMQSPSSYRGEWWNERAKGPYWQYPPGWKMNDVLVQRSLLVPHLRGLDASHIEPLLRRYLVADAYATEHRGGYRVAPSNGNRLLLPDGMDGLLTLPKLDRLASLVSGKKGWTDINKAISFLLGVLREFVPSFKDWTEGRFCSEFHRLNDTVARALAEDAARTPGDFHVLPVQSGALYAGYSVRAARGHIAARHREYGMPCFMAACLILGSPGRIAEGALVMDCAGTERAPRVGGSFRTAPYFYWDVDGPRFGGGWIDRPVSCSGSASFVLPE